MRLITKLCNRTHFWQLLPLYGNSWVGKSMCYRGLQQYPRNMWWSSALFVDMNANMGSMLIISHLTPPKMRIFKTDYRSNQSISFSKPFYCTAIFFLDLLVVQNFSKVLFWVLGLNCFSILLFYWLIVINSAPGCGGGWKSHKQTNKAGV